MPGIDGVDSSHARDRRLRSGHDASHAHRSVRLRAAGRAHRAAAGCRRATRRGCWWCGRAAALEDRGVRDLPDLLNPGDALVVNDTQVIPARLTGRRIGRDTEPKIEATLTERLDGSRWRAFVRPAKKLARRRRRPLRRGGQGLLPRPARRHGGGQGRGRRGDAVVRLPRAGARPGHRRAGRHAAAALYRVQAQARRAGPRRLPDPVRPRRRLGRGADRGPAFHRRAAGQARGARHRRAQGDAACRAGHLPAGQGRRHRRTTGCTPNMR